jgi:ABC-type glycerol-3-phosphate transport system permease component
LKEWKSVAKITSAERLQRWLDASLTFFMLAIIFFLLAGISAYVLFFSQSEYQSLLFSIFLVGGIIALILGLIQVYRIARTLGKDSW